MKKIKIGILFGGKSAEHNVSIISAISVIKHLDSKYIVIPIYIDVKNKWHWLNLENDKRKTFCREQIKKIQSNFNNDGNFSIANEINFNAQSKKLDVIFPVLHGSLGEDGAIQGLLELLEIPYISSGILSSAVTMDKEITKKILYQAGINITPYISIKEYEYNADNKDIFLKKILDKFSFPLFIKPSNNGSSVGINKVKDAIALEKAIAGAFMYDQKILIEQGIIGKEIEISVLENIDNYSNPIVSYPGELIPNDEFYSYNAKYIMEDGVKFEIPAKLLSSIENLVKKNAGDIFKILECNCLARVDFFLEYKTNKLFFNEINTLPGFTEVSLYPKLLEYCGIKYPELLDKLISLAIKKYKAKQVKINNSVNILSSI